MNNPELAVRIMRRLRDKGLALHIDDFGTGYSSLGSLRHFPIEALKIDRSFIASMGEDNKGSELVNMIVAMGRNLDVDVIAEGIETREQRDHLATFGCRLGQGFWFARAVASAEIPALLVQPLPLGAPAGGAVDGRRSVGTVP